MILTDREFRIWSEMDGRYDERWNLREFLLTFPPRSSLKDYRELRELALRFQPIEPRDLELVSPQMRFSHGSNKLRLAFAIHVGAELRQNFAVSSSEPADWPKNIGATGVESRLSLYKLHVAGAFSGNVGPPDENGLRLWKFLNLDEAGIEVRGDRRSKRVDVFLPATPLVEGPSGTFRLALMEGRTIKDPDDSREFLLGWVNEEDRVKMTPVGVPVS